MSKELMILIVTAISIGFFHTLIGPDHYLPFIAIKMARKWSLKKTAWVTLLCGIGHVGSSVLLGLIGITLGIAVTKLEVLESSRGNIATWFLIAFGLFYFIWGLRRALKNQPHQHKHFHSNGTEHIHEHTHTKEHVHIHEEESGNITVWVLFTIFVFGPCEPLIPLLMYPAAKGSLLGVFLVTAIFGTVTIATMLGIVLMFPRGLITFLPFKRLERYSHALAGATIFLCGMAIQFLGL